MTVIKYRALHIGWHDILGQSLSEGELTLSVKRKGQLDAFLMVLWRCEVWPVAHFPSIGSDDPPPSPPLGVKNVKIQENSEKIRGPPGGP